MSERQFLRQMAALNEPTRLKIIYILSKRNFCAIHIEQLIGQSQSNISRHLEKLINADIVAYRKNGRRNIYYITKEFIDENPNMLEHISSFYDQEFSDQLLSDLAVECDQLVID